MQNSSNNSFSRLLESGTKFFNAGDYKKARKKFRDAVKLEPNDPQSLNLLGLSLNGCGDKAGAIKYIEKALQVGGNHPIALNNLGQIYSSADRAEDAERTYRLALTLAPNSHEILSNLGNLLSEREQFDDAEDCYRSAIQTAPDYIPARYNLGNLFLAIKNFGVAQEIFTEVLNQNRSHFEARNNLGYCYLKLGQSERCIQELRQVVNEAPEFPKAHNNLGLVFLERKDWPAAVDCFERCLELDPQNGEAANNMGLACREIGDYARALAYFEQALKLDSQDYGAFINNLAALMDVCSWQKVALEKLKLEKLCDAKRSKIPGPECLLTVITCSDDAELIYDISQATIVGLNEIASLQKLREWPGTPDPEKHLTVGYISHDFRNHAVGHLVYDLFRHHDRAAIKCICYSHGENDNSFVLEAIKGSCDKFSDISSISDGDAAKLIREDEVDILIDLSIYTKGGRPEILAYHPAPVQVSYLGFPSTSGSPIYDYLIADKVVIPEDQAKYFSETITYLDPYYVISSLPVQNDQHEVARAEEGLPEDGFVFCSFNRANKIEPLMFQAWMDILIEVPNSALWLIEDNALASVSLRKEAELRGVSPDRLIFAPKVSRGHHLARLKLADVALDTRVYNGSITTADALWAGIPVVTMMGNYIPSRATASILTAISLEELIASDIEHYKSISINLASSPSDLKRLQGCLTHEHLTSTLFNVQGKAKELETLYREMWANYCRQPKRN